MSYSLKSLRVVRKGSSIGVMKGDTSVLDYSLNGPFYRPPTWP